MATGPKRTKFERESNLERITGMYLRGMTQTEIADELGLSQAQISYDLKEVNRRWREDTKMDLDAAKQQELSKLKELEHTYWQAWKTSLGIRRKTKVEGVGKDRKFLIEKEKMMGNPSFLAGIISCIQERAKLLGIYAPVKQDVKVNFADELKDLLVSGAVSQDDVINEVGPDYAKELFESIGVLVTE